MSSEIITRFDVGAFWNPNGGIIVSDRKLLRNEVGLLKRSWSEQIPAIASRFGCGWHRLKQRIFSFFSQ